MAAIILLVSVAAYLLKPPPASLEVNSVFENQSSRDQVLVLAFITEIRESSDAFYAPYYTLSPTVAAYDTTGKGVD